MTDRPLTLRPRPLKAALRAPPAPSTFRRPADGMYKNLVVGDRLWLREQFYLPRNFNGHSPTNAEGHVDAPTYAIDIDGQDPKQLGLGLSRAAYTLPRFWSRYHFVVISIERQRLLDISEAEARADGFTSRKDWLAEWDSMVTAVGGRSPARAAASNPSVLAIGAKLQTHAIDSPTPNPRKAA